MTLIEITLLAIAKVLLLILFFYENISAFIQNAIAKNPTLVNKLLNICKKLYIIFVKFRKFSLSYVLKNRLQKLYILFPISIIILKLSTNYSFVFENFIPQWIHKGIDFFTISAIWELFCFITRIIDNYFKKIDK